MDGVISLVELYKKLYEDALCEIAESHSSEDEEIDGTTCFKITRGCQFCEQYKLFCINKSEDYK